MSHSAEEIGTLDRAIEALKAERRALAERRKATDAEFDRADRALDMRVRDLLARRATLVESASG